MSGLETAIRNALDRAERDDGQVRARIYQSARQALDAGLRKQGVTDNLVIMQQRKRLEEKIQEIEGQEIDRLAQAARPSLGAGQVAGMEPSWAPEPGVDARRDPDADIPPPVAAVEAPVARPIPVASEVPAARVSPEPMPEAGALGGVTRSDPAFDGPVAAPSIDGPATRPAFDEAPAARPATPVGKNSKVKAGKLDMPARRAAKPRRRRGFLSHLVTWLVTLGVVAVGGWIFYSSGAVQSIIEDAMRAASRPGGVQSAGEGPSALTSRGGFSEEWSPIFEPKEGAAFRTGSQAQAQIATGSEGQALKVDSASPGAAGDVAIEVPVDILRELAGKSSTLAVTIQSAVNRPSQLSIRCDFGSLGACSRHRFTATQEKLDALFKVSFEGTLVPNAPGRLIVNSGVGGGSQPVFIYSVRALPGQ